MFIFLARWFKGILLGWIAALAMYLVKRIITKAFNMERPPHWPENETAAGNPRGKAPQGDVIDTLYTGMSEQQLLSAMKEPMSKLTCEGNVQIWVYPTRVITLEKGNVTKWENKDSV
ncbi:MAG: hypothetical protein WC043_05150 [Pseudobdellovibrionaceae bacterium]